MIDILAITTIVEANKETLMLISKSKSKKISFKDPAMLVSMAAFVLAGTALLVTASASSQLSSIYLNQPNPHLGQSVTFNVTLPKTVKNPQLILDCFQNQVLVYEQRGLPTDTYLLGGTSSAWLTSGGPASCTANVYDLVTKAGQVNYMAKAVMTFNAAGAQ